MSRALRLTAAALFLGATAAAAQLPAPNAQVKATPNAGLLSVSLGPLGTGRIVESTPVGSIGLFHSDLAQVVSSSPEAEREARVFARDQMIGRPLVLLGGGAVVAGLAAYVGRGGSVGIGGREMAAVAIGTGGLMLGAARLAVSRTALARAVEIFNRDR